MLLSRIYPKLSSDELKFIYFSLICNTLITCLVFQLTSPLKYHRVLDTFSTRGDMWILIPFFKKLFYYFSLFFHNKCYQISQFFLLSMTEKYPVTILIVHTAVAELSTLLAVNTCINKVGVN